MKIRFDDSLPKLVEIVEGEIGKQALVDGVAIRDISGRLSFISSSILPKKLTSKLTKRLLLELGPYARKDRLIVSSEDIGAEFLLLDKNALTVNVSGSLVRLIDRRLIGADWLRVPAPKAPLPVRFVFASIKGGVGRSTALAIAAAHLAGKGRRVLAIDLDMEAPGLGALLLDDTTLPEFGLIDALVENGLGSLDSQFLADMIGPSSLADNHGRIDVIPAFGRRSVENPSNVLSKISRAYMDDVSDNGQAASVLDQIVELVNRFAMPNRYDAILIDARAGLHETTATAILGLGAEVFLFGLDEPQNFQGYAALFGHLAQFKNLKNGALLNWLERVSMVQGKAPLNEAARREFVDRCAHLFYSTGLEAPIAIAAEPLPAAEPFIDVPWDDELSDEEVLPSELVVVREPVAILHDDSFRQFNPAQRRDLLSEAAYMKSYGIFLSRIMESFPDIEKKNA